MNATCVEWHKLNRNEVRFAFKCDDGAVRECANMWHEDFARLRQGGLRFPVAVSPSGTAVNVSDARVKAKWFKRSG